MKKFLLLFLILSILLCLVSCVKSEQIQAPLKDEINTETTENIAPENCNFEVHFIDVGQADASLILCDGQSMLIDGGNAEDSSLIYSYLKERNVDVINYMIATHAHEDHIGGLPGALSFANVERAFCPSLTYDSKVFDTFLNYLEKENVTLEVPKSGDSFELGSSKVEILSCDTEQKDENNKSIVLKITYGDTSFLFTADAEREAEEKILDSNFDLKSDVLKVGHHGSENSTTYPFLREIMPKYAVISVGADNDYGHPTKEALSRLRDADVKVFRTDIQGTIVCKSDGNNVYFTVSKNENTDTFGNLEEGSNQNQFTYVGNKNSKKFHTPDCSSVKNISDSNIVYFDIKRSEIIDKGYSPCGSCKP
ncbi:MAG: MBL fold metallo-hydrolase [Ruminococcaceae bacterium]|nr:MBL fold metallo-hydrolase [Oscillospiraceae bacterium]